LRLALNIIKIQSIQKNNYFGFRVEFVVFFETHIPPGWITLVVWRVIQHTNCRSIRKPA